MIIKDIKINPNKIIRVSRDIVNDNSYFQMRCWTRDARYKNFKPTKRFIVMNTSKLIELIPFLVISLGNSGNQFFD